jgi:hypothetical protein
LYKASSAPPTCVTDIHVGGLGGYQGGYHEVPPSHPPTLNLQKVKPKGPSVNPLKKVLFLNFEHTIEIPMPKLVGVRNFKLEK